MRCSIESKGESDERFNQQAPIVDAIPIQYIEDTIRLAEKVGAKEYAEHLEVLLADWAERKEK